MSQPRLRVVPCTVEKAKEYVDATHRHHTSSTSARFCVAVIDEAGLVRGVAMIGRPVARLLDDGWTLEVNRVATDGCENACSALYGQLYASLRRSATPSSSPTSARTSPVRRFALRGGIARRSFGRARGIRRVVVALTRRA